MGCSNGGGGLLTGRWLVLKGHGLSKGTGGVLRGRGWVLNRWGLSKGHQWFCERARVVQREAVGF